jgi:hypothetical protein
MQEIQAMNLTILMAQGMILVLMVENLETGNMHNRSIEITYFLDTSGILEKRKGDMSPKEVGVWFLSIAPLHSTGKYLSKLKKWSN